MKIAWNAMQVRAAKSGVGQCIHALAEAVLQIDNTNDYTLYASPQNAANYAFTASNFRQRVWGLPESKKWFRLANEYTRFPSELESAKYDILHGLSNFLPARKVCPYVVTVYDLSYYVHPERCPFMRRQYWYAMTRRTLQVADAIITISENSRRDIERFFPETRNRIEVIPLAAHARFHRVPYQRAESAVARHGLAAPYILFVGTLEPGKNIERVIEAFDSIAADLPQHQLVIIGDRGWLYDRILQRIQSSPARDRIRLLGHLPDADVVDFLNFCDVFVFPSLYEGFGLPPLEAMACGAPVVTSNTSSIPEVVGDAALTVDPTSASDIAAAIRRVLTDTSLHAELQARGVVRARHFSWAKTAQQTLDVYRRIG